MNDEEDIGNVTSMPTLYIGHNSSHILHIRKEKGVRRSEKGVGCLIGSGEKV